MKGRALGEHAPLQLRAQFFPATRLTQRVQQTSSTPALYTTQTREGATFWGHRLASLRRCAHGMTG